MANLCGPQGLGFRVQDSYDKKLLLGLGEERCGQVSRVFGRSRYPISEVYSNILMYMHIYIHIYIYMFFISL